MDKQGFIDFNTRFSPENSGRADSYAKALAILERVLPYHPQINLQGKSLYEINDTATIENIKRLVKEEVRKMKSHQPNIFDYGQPNQKSYPLGGFCSAALGSLVQYAEYDQELKQADDIVAHESNPKLISTKLIAHFDIEKDVEGEDIETITKQRKGQDYFRRMILSNYAYRCALTGIDIPQLLLASHIIPWADKSHKKERLNPCNGICLSSLYDKAFDKGLMGFDSNYKVVLSQRLKGHCTESYYERYFGCVDRKELDLPNSEFKPDLTFLEYHMDTIFQK